MTLEDIRIMNEFKNEKDVYASSLDHEKTIFGLNKMTEQEVKKIITIEAEWFVRNNPDYVFTDIKVLSKGNNSVTYNMVFARKNATYGSTH